MFDLLLLLFFFSIFLFLSVKNHKGFLHINFFFSLYLFFSFYLRGYFVITEGYSEVLSHIGFANDIDTFEVLITLVFVLFAQIVVYKTSNWFKVGKKLDVYSRLFTSKLSSLPSLVVSQKKLLLLLLLFFPPYYISYFRALSRVLYSSTATSSISTNEYGQIVSGSGSSGYFTIFLCLSPFIALLFSLILRGSIPTLLIAGAFVLFNLSQGSYRLLGISAAISFALSYIYLRPLCITSSGKKFIVNLKHINVLLGIVTFIFAVSSWSKAYIRSLFWADAEISSLTRGDHLTDVSGSSFFSSFHCFDSLIAIMRIYPHKTEGFNLWTGQLRLLIWPIPRQLWPDKPVTTEWTNIFDTGRWAPLTLGFFGDSYANLGILGILISVLVLTFIFLKIHSWSLQSIVELRSPVPLICYLVTLSYISVFLRDGGTSWGVWIIPLWIFIWMAKPLLPKFKT